MEREHISSSPPREDQHLETTAAEPLLAERQMRPDNVRSLIEHPGITTTVKTSQAMSGETIQLRLAVDTIPELLWSALPDGHIDFLNQRWREYTGLTLEQARGRDWRAAIHSDDLTGLERHWRTVLASGKPGETEARLRRFDGEYRWFLFRAVPWYDERGHVVKWYGTTTDIQDRKWAEALLAGEKRLLEMIAKGDSLAPILEAVCRLVEEMSSDCLCLILLLDSDGNRLRHGAAPSLPASYTRAIDGCVIGPSAGSWGTAVHRTSCSWISLSIDWVASRQPGPFSKKFLNPKPPSLRTILQ